VRAEQVWKIKEKYASYQDFEDQHIYIVRIEGDIIFYKVVTPDGNMIKQTLTGNDDEFEIMGSKNKIFQTYELVR